MIFQEYEDLGDFFYDEIGPIIDEYYLSIHFNVNASTMAEFYVSLDGK